MDSGDVTLEDILNDADTGTKKLQPGSPPASVKAVQQAFFDLNWTTRIDPPVFDAAQFVIGTYGPLTTKVTLAYKTHYDIHFSPLANTGIIDGFVGPRTLLKLDKHCVLFDEADASLTVRADQERATDGSFFFSSTPILGTTGAVRTKAGGGSPLVNSATWFKRGRDSFLVSGRLLEAFTDNGRETGELGFPISEARNESQTVTIQDFENGKLRLRGTVVEVELADDPGPLVIDPSSF